METTLRKRLGTTDLDVFPICLGCNPLGWTANEQESFAVLDAFVAAGGNFIDTADEYSDWAAGNNGGESETIIGRWMRSRRNRSRIILATKVGLYKPLRGLAKQTIRTAIEGSLKRLQTDYIDLYYAHADDPNTPQLETLASFETLIQHGKVRYLGASNFSASRLDQALETSQVEGLAAYAVVQPHYNLIDRNKYEGDLMAVCRSRGLAAVPFQGLAQGFLTGKYRPSGPPVASAREPKVQELYMNAAGFAVLRVVEAIADELSVPMAAVALAWLLAQPTVVAPIAGASRATQVPSLASAAGLQFSSDQLSRLTAAGA